MCHNPQGTIYMTSGFSYIFVQQRYRVQMTLFRNRWPLRNDAANAIPISEKLCVTTKLQKINLQQLLYPSIQQHFGAAVYINGCFCLFTKHLHGRPLWVQSQAMQS